jgi:predicted RNA-binding Zn-ribbon protein involved in translation (DUF1610 family)
MAEEMADGAGYALAAIRTIGEPLQQRVQAWVEATFPTELHTNLTERGDRLLEETLELLQSTGYDPARIAILANYVYGRPAGEPAQEAGGVMLTLAALCTAAGVDMIEAGEAELARVTQPHITEAIQAKQRAKAAIRFGATAAPGIDLAALREIVSDLSHSAKFDDYEPQQIAFIGAILGRLRELIDASPKGGSDACIWTDDGEGNWATACGDVFVLLEGNPSENNMRHCPFCGSGLQTTSAEVGSWSCPRCGSKTGEQCSSCGCFSNEQDASPKGGSDALLREVREELEADGVRACIGSTSPMENLHGRIAAHLDRLQATSAEVGE